MLLPGGPGLGSESLHELADGLALPGTTWMVDLPGDGSNVTPPGTSGDPFQRWPEVILEAAHAHPNAVLVGHSTGGMYLLSSPALEQSIVGLALISSAPSAAWQPRFAEMTQRDPLPEVAAATRVYEADRSPANLRHVAVASAPWNFTPEGLAAGRELLGRMPYNPDAVDWSDKNFDTTYAAKWWPATTPTLIVSGAEDRIVDQSLWRQPSFSGANVLHRTIEAAGHFPWIERPGDVQRAFAELGDLAEAYASSRQSPDSRAS